MRAVVQHEYGGPEKLKLEDNVTRAGDWRGTVLIAAAAACVNPIDWKVVHICAHRPYDPTHVAAQNWRKVCISSGNSSTDEMGVCRY